MGADALDRVLPCHFVAPAEDRPAPPPDPLSCVVELLDRWGPRVERTLPDARERSSFWQAVFASRALSPALAGNPGRAEQGLQQRLDAWLAKGVNA